MLVALRGWSSIGGWQQLEFDWWLAAARVRLVLGLCAFVRALNVALIGDAILQVVALPAGLS